MCVGLWPVTAGLSPNPTGQGYLGSNVTCLRLGLFGDIEVRLAREQTTEVFDRIGQVSQLPATSTSTQNQPGLPALHTGFSTCVAFCPDRSVHAKLPHHSFLNALESTRKGGKSRQRNTRNSMIQKQGILRKLHICCQSLEEYCLASYYGGSDIDDQGMRSENFAQKFKKNRNRSAKAQLQRILNSTPERSRRKQQTIPKEESQGFPQFA
ncbi:hypothetical protein B0T17DRAFT_512221 [Bombardia bombarda]|uniref:Uncharacterized protein n=1 Tax=Bombardia bombarda TaxID=252184 RepID=A0AA39W9P3_9PEZI|nr:hypothetical protein B0T17DRAFT_512221 [Bombardia bombarda]